MVNCILSKSCQESARGLHAPSGGQLNAIPHSTNSGSGMARKKGVPDHVAVRLVQKAKDAEKKAKAAEKKAKSAEKKAIVAEKKTKAAEKKAIVAEKKTKAAEKKSKTADEKDDFDDFDDFDDDSDADKEVDSGDGEDHADADDSEQVDEELASLLEKASLSEDPEARTAKMMREGNFEGALEVWKKQTVEDSENADNWRGLATVLDAMDEGDKANTVRMHLQRLEAQAVSEVTGRSMEDIMADLLDDGVLNFSAGSDAKTQKD